MLDIIKSILPELVGGILAIICAIVGAKLVIHANTLQANSKELQEAYADVFAAYYSCITSMSDKNILGLVSAMERARLLCSPTSEELMREVVQMLLTDTEDTEKLGSKIQQLRDEAKKDVCNAKRK